MNAGFVFVLARSVSLCRQGLCLSKLVVSLLWLDLCVGCQRVG